MRVDFYQVSGRFHDPLEVASILIGKAFPETSDIVVVGPSTLLEELDQRLWETPQGRFLAHGIEDGRAPIQLRREPPDRAGILINLDADADLPVGSFERVLEIVPDDELVKSRLRRRWKDWKSRGAELHHHVLK